MKNSILRGTRVATLVSALLTVASMAALAAPSALNDNHADVTADGLHRVDSAVLPLAWKRPGVDFKRYKKVMFVPDGMTFKGRISDANDEFAIPYERQQLLNKMMLDVFTEELGKLERYTLVDKAGKDVLVVRGAMLDIVSHVSPRPVSDAEPKIATPIGEATLVVELQDSMTGEFLARGMDRRVAFSAAELGDNAAQLRNVARRWASELRRRLEAL